MRISNSFNRKRFFLLLKKDFYTQYKTYLIALGAIFGILLIVNICSITSFDQWNFNLVFYPLTLFIGGFIFTSLSFQELAHEQSRISYLTLPASNLEKFISRLITTSIGYVVVSLVLYFLFSAFAFAMNKVIFGYAHPIFNPSHPVIGLCILIYLVTQSIFLFGAIYFRGNTFIKTTLSLFILATMYWIFIILVTLLSFYILSWTKHLYFSFDLFLKGYYYQFTPSGIKSFFEVCYRIIQFLFWFILAPFFWIISIIHLKEIEA
jgi:hypothetical protein